MLNGKKLVVVLGMHRSGTSTIARALKALGIELGDNLIVPGFDNPKGFWEDFDIVQLNDDVLATLDRAYDTLEPIYPEQLDLEALLSFKERASTLLIDKMASVHCFGLKDPRMTRLLPFWKPIFDALNLDVRYVIASRHPKSVARSLAQRNHFFDEKGYLLWFEHVLWSLIETQGKPRMIVDYDQLMENSIHALKQMAILLDVTVDETSIEFIEYTQIFLDKTLTHTQYQLNDLLEERFISQEMITLYQLVQKAAADIHVLTQNDAIKCLEQLQYTLKNNHIFLHYLSMLESELAKKEIEHAQQEERLVSKALGISYFKDELLQTTKDQAEQITLLTHALRDINLNMYRYHHYLSKPWKIPSMLTRKLKKCFS